MARILGSAILQGIAINLFSGFITTGVDQAAHIDGVLVGFITGVFIYPNSSRLGAWHRIRAPALVGLAGSIVMALSAYHDGSAELLEWKRELATQRAQELAESVEAPGQGSGEATDH